MDKVSDKLSSFECFKTFVENTKGSNTEVILGSHKFMIEVIRTTRPREDSDQHFRRIFWGKKHVTGIIYQCIVYRTEQVYQIILLQT